MCFHSVLDMGKTNKERQAEQREKLKNHEKPFNEYLSKDWMRKKLKWLEDNKKPKPEQDAFMAAES